ncbi:CFEM domain-containing protein [Mycena indigotica]|uniref:CFEM domain-containing protein n=1 Tax=Mycena indigotica TaxID=2126181 RepID=A0A8H6S3C7_9AGAR|nr:CFEM domain-containing protein [Mycena indigotica]KAF7291102.1 CFEM domain-containing protein [Mycena indigotica]
MRFTAAAALFSLFAATAASTVTRRQFPGFPDCSQDCLAHPNLDTCKAGDNTCLCNNSVFVQSTFTCIQNACKGQDLATAIEGAYQLCLAVHVTLVSAKGAEFSATASLPSASGNASAATSAPASASRSPAPSTTPNAALGRSASTTLGLVAIGALAMAL